MTDSDRKRLRELAVCDSDIFQWESVEQRELALAVLDRLLGGRK